MERKIMAIVNPASANGSTGKKWPEIQKIAENMGMVLNASLTDKPGDATILTRKALLQGYTEIVAVGGDGTVNEVINGFFDKEGNCIRKDAALGVLPRGTGCDFIKSMKIPHTQEQALQTILTGALRSIDVGKCDFISHEGKPETRYFVNIADLGIGGATAKRVNASSKRFGGFLSFLYASLATVMVYENKKLEIMIDDMDPIRVRSNAVIVANGKYFGGGMKIAPEAELDDGEFNVIVLGDFRRWEIIGNFFRIYKGTHSNHPKVSMYRARTVLVRSEEECLLDMDGEQPGRSNAKFNIVHGILRVIS